MASKKTSFFECARQEYLTAKGLSGSGLQHSIGYLEGIRTALIVMGQYADVLEQVNKWLELLREKADNA